MEPYRNDNMTNTEQGATDIYNNSTQSNFHTVVCSVGLAVGAMAVVGNILNLLVLPRLSNVTGTYRFLLISLAVSDFFAGLTSFSYLLYSIQSDPTVTGSHDGLWCRFSGYVITVMAMTDIAVVMCVAIYKYVMITKPLRYSLYMTTRRAGAVVVVLFLFVAVLLGFCSSDNYPFENSIYQTYFGICLIDFASPPLLKWTAVIFTVDVYLPILIVCFLYARIAVIARQQARRIAVTSSMSMESRGVELHRNNGRSVTELTTTQRSVSAWKGLRSALLLTFGFMIAWVPFTIVYILLASGADVTFSPYFMTIIGNLVMSTTWWNYVIYSLCSSEFRYTALNLLEQVWDSIRFCSDCKR